MVWCSAFCIFVVGFDILDLILIFAFLWWNSRNSLIKLCISMMMIVVVVEFTLHILQFFDDFL